MLKHCKKILPLLAPHIKKVSYPRKTLFTSSSSFLHSTRSLNSKYHTNTLLLENDDKKTELQNEDKEINPEEEQELNEIRNLIFYNHPDDEPHPLFSDDKFLNEFLNDEEAITDLNLTEEDIMTMKSNMETMMGSLKEISTEMKETIVNGARIDEKTDIDKELTEIENELHHTLKSEYPLETSLMVTKIVNLYSFIKRQKEKVEMKESKEQVTIKEEIKNEIKEEEEKQQVKEEEVVVEINNAQHLRVVKLMLPCITRGFTDINEIALKGIVHKLSKDLSPNVVKLLAIEDTVKEVKDIPRFLLKEFKENETFKGFIESIAKEISLINMLHEYQDLVTNLIKQNKLNEFKEKYNIDLEIENYVSSFYLLFYLFILENNNSRKNEILNLFNSFKKNMRLQQTKIIDFESSLELSLKDCIDVLTILPDIDEKNVDKKIYELNSIVKRDNNLFGLICLANLYYLKGQPDLSLDLIDGIKGLIAPQKSLHTLADENLRSEVLIKLADIYKSKGDIQKHKEYIRNAFDSLDMSMSYTRRSQTYVSNLLKYFYCSLEIDDLGEGFEESKEAIVESIINLVDSVKYLLNDEALLEYTFKKIIFIVNGCKEELRLEKAESKEKVKEKKEPIDEKNDPTMGRIEEYDPHEDIDNILSELELYYNPSFKNTFTINFLIVYLSIFTGKIAQKDGLQKLGKYYARLDVDRSKVSPLERHFIKDVREEMIKVAREIQKGQLPVLE
ncbi:hypothetical protein ABK040_004101 [Willaertia magna]